METYTSLRFTGVIYCVLEARWSRRSRARGFVNGMGLRMAIASTEDEARNPSARNSTVTQADPHAILAAQGLVAARDTISTNDIGTELKSVGARSLPRTKVLRPHKSHLVSLQLFVQHTSTGSHRVLLVSMAIMNSIHDRHISAWRENHGYGSRHLKE